MTFTFENLTPTKREKKQARLSSREKRLIKSQRHLRCAITNETFTWQDRFKGQIHHKLDVQYGGTADRKNLVILGNEAHHKVHLVARIQGERLWRSSERFKKMRNIEGARRIAYAEASVDTTNHAIQMTSLSLIADLGYDVRYVYGDDYAEDPKERERIDKLLGQLEG